MNRIDLLHDLCINHELTCIEIGFKLCHRSGAEDHAADKRLGCHKGDGHFRRRHSVAPGQRRVGRNRRPHAGLVVALSKRGKQGDAPRRD